MNWLAANWPWLVLGGVGFLVADIAWTCVSVWLESRRNGGAK